MTNKPSTVDTCMVVKWLDETVPAGVFDNERSERLWDACCSSHPENPFEEWEKLDILLALNRCASASHIKNEDSFLPTAT